MEEVREGEDVVEICYEGERRGRRKRKKNGESWSRREKTGRTRGDPQRANQAELTCLWPIKRQAYCRNTTRTHTEWSVKRGWMNNAPKGGCGALMRVCVSVRVSVCVRAYEGSLPRFTMRSAGQRWFLERTRKAG